MSADVLSSQASSSLAKTFVLRLLPLGLLSLAVTERRMGSAIYRMQQPCSTCRGQVCIANSYPYFVIPNASNISHLFLVVI